MTRPGIVEIGYATLQDFDTNTKRWELTQSMCRKDCWVELRSGEDLARYNGPPVDTELDIRDFHQDGENSSRPRYLLLWSNVFPTEVRDPDGEVFTLTAGMLTLIDNWMYNHRMPLLDYEQALQRSFFRCIFLINNIKTSTIDEIVEGARRFLDGNTATDLTQAASVSERTEENRILG